jgi:LysM repeat protein
VVIFGVVVLCACLVAVLPSTRWVLFGLPQISSKSSSAPNYLPTVFDLVQPTATLTIQPTIAIPSEALVQTSIPSPTLIGNSVAPTLVYSGIDYCLYVLQPGETLQSVSSRFQVNESELRTIDNSTGLYGGSKIQMIRVNAPCCRPANVNGISYTVEYGETLSSIAQKYAVSVSELATVNNLFDSSYIQTWQMLCIPTR